MLTVPKFFRAFRVFLIGSSFQGSHRIKFFSKRTFWNVILDNNVQSEFFAEEIKAITFKKSIYLLLQYYLILFFIFTYSIISEYILLNKIYMHLCCKQDDCLSFFLCRAMRLTNKTCHPFFSFFFIFIFFFLES